MLFYL